MKNKKFQKKLKSIELLYSFLTPSPSPYHGQGELNLFKRGYAGVESWGGINYQAVLS
jgi:hypothetical protein